MNYFKKKRPHHAKHAHPVLTKAMQQLDNHLRNLATYLQVKAGLFSQKKQRMVLLFVSAVCLGANGWLAIKNIKAPDQGLLTKTPVRISPLLDERNRSAVPTRSIRVPVWLDSLQHPLIDSSSRTPEIPTSLKTK